MQIYVRYFCILCGSGTGHGHKIFCPYCEFQLNQEMGVWCRSMEGVDVYSVLRWTSRSPEALSVLSERAKEVKSTALFDFFARALISRIPLEVFRGKKLLVLPSSTGRIHSAQLGESLARILRLPLDFELSVKGNQRQPGLSRKQRFDRELRLSPQALSRNYKDVLFVDDVITTGATMKAALDAVKPSSGAFGVTLFAREL